MAKINILKNVSGIMHVPLGQLCLKKFPKLSNLSFEYINQQKDIFKKELFWIFKAALRSAI